MVSTMENMTSTMESVAQHGALTAQKLDSFIEAFEKYKTERAGESKRYMNMAESRSVQGLKVYSGDRDSFKIWNAKLINMISSAVSTEWRDYMNKLTQKLDQYRKPLEVEELTEIEGYDELPRKKDVDENLYYVLVEKTDGDAALRVQSGKQGQGVNAYMRLYLWFSGTTGLALSEKVAQLMNPKFSMIEHELADTLEKVG